MARETITVGVVVERRKLKSKWADHAWMPVAVLPGAPVAEPWSVLDHQPEVTRFFAGPAQLELFGSDTGSYRDNLQSGQPGIWVVLAPSDEPPGASLHSVTADPAEGEGMTASGGWIVEPVPMPPEIYERVAAFVAAHHVERAFFKRKRDRADPDRGAPRPGRREPGAPE